MTCPGLQQRIFGSPVSRPDHYLMALHAGLDGSVWLPPPTTNTSNNRSRLQMSISAGTFWRLQSPVLSRSLSAHRISFVWIVYHLVVLFILNDRNKINLGVWNIWQLKLIGHCSPCNLLMSSYTGSFAKKEPSRWPHLTPHTDWIIVSDCFSAQSLYNSADWSAVPVILMDLATEKCQDH